MSIMIGVNNNMKEVSNMEDKNQKLPSTRIQCDTEILEKQHSNP